MPGTVVMLHNPFRPDRDREVIAVAEPLSIREWLGERGIDEFDHPTICLRNGSPVLRDRWGETEIGENDLVVFVPLPQGGGGGGKNPLRTILMLAVMVAAPYLGGLIAGAIGVTSTIGISLITAGVALVGTTLVNVLLPPPKPAAPSFGKGVPSPSPTYSLTAQGNQARLTQPIPVVYGRHRVFPDLAATPWAEYDEQRAIPASAALHRPGRARGRADPHRGHADRLLRGDRDRVGGARRRGHPVRDRRRYGARDRRPGADRRQRPRGRRGRLGRPLHRQPGRHEGHRDRHRCGDAARALLRGRRRQPRGPHRHLGGRGPGRRRRRRGHRRLDRGRLRKRDRGREHAAAQELSLRPRCRALRGEGQAHQRQERRCPRRPRHPLGRAQGLPRGRARVRRRHLARRQDARHRQSLPALGPARQLSSSPANCRSGIPRPAGPSRGPRARSPGPSPTPPGHATAPGSTTPASISKRSMRSMRSGNHAATASMPCSTRASRSGRRSPASPAAAGRCPSCKAGYCGSPAMRRAPSRWRCSGRATSSGAASASSTSCPARTPPMR